VAGGKQRAGGGAGAGDVFDVRVVAFAGGSAATLKALQDLFGLDREGAQRLFDNVPLVVRRAAPANEAQNFVQALQGIGAQVSLERPGEAAGTVPVPTARKAPPPPPRAAPPPPAPPRGKAPPPPPREAEPLPRPIMRAPTADLEFDLMQPGLGDSDKPEPEPKSATQSISKRARNEFDFADEPNTGSLELDIPGAREVAAAPQRNTLMGNTSNGAPQRNTLMVNASNAAPQRNTLMGNTSNGAPQRNTLMGNTSNGAPQRNTLMGAPTRNTSNGGPNSERSARDADPQEESLDVAAPAAPTRGDPTSPRMSNPDIGTGPGPMSRAAVIQQPSAAELAAPKRQRQIALLRVLGAVAVAAIGIQLDSSIVYGNANLLSVVAHAVAIYQLGIGLRGMAA
jgi:hypothetical protein